MTPQPPPSKPAFNKPWLSCREQVALLQERGLIVADPATAADFLSHVNYYRFSGYCLAFEQARHQFHRGVTFEQIQAAYEFDRALRDLVTEALEIVELDLRTAIADRLSRQYGPFGHTDPGHFFKRFDHEDWTDKMHRETERSREPFVQHFKATYRQFPDLPIWMAAEIMSFGLLSRMFKGMMRVDQKSVSSRYGRQPTDMASWVHHVVYVRNLCAHHSRLWDRIWSIKPDLPAGKAWQPPLLSGNNRLFVTLLILCTLLRRCPPWAPSPIGGAGGSTSCSPNRRPRQTR
jgi:abortive infection bacteriophage resistance protein